MAMHSQAIVHASRDFGSQVKNSVLASNTSLDIHSNEACNYYDYLLIKNRSGTIKSAH